MATRTALVSDVHGNAVALEAVAAALERDAVDQVVCLGDVAQGGPQPAEVIDRIRQLGWPVVLGNADDFLLDPEAGAEPATPRLLEVREWSVSRLGPDRLEYIGSFSPTVEADLGDGRRLLGFHGSPASYDDVILPWLETEVVHGFLTGRDASVLAGGHVHLQWLHRVGDGVFVNPGSVGLGYDHHQPEGDFRFDAYAAYAVVAVGDQVEVSFRRAPFAWQAVVDAISESGLPHGAEFARRWVPRAVAPDPVGLLPR